MAKKFLVIGHILSFIWAEELADVLRQDSYTTHLQKHTLLSNRLPIVDSLQDGFKGILLGFFGSELV